MISPCVKICRLDERHTCEGCGRTAREIRLWSSYSDAERAAIMARLAVREPTGSAAD